MTNELSNLHNSRSMSSKEIAELTGKEHKNVLRDIQNILETLSGTAEMTHLKFQVSNNGQDRSHLYCPFVGVN